MDGDAQAGYAELGGVAFVEIFEADMGERSGDSRRTGLRTWVRGASPAGDLKVAVSGEIPHPRDP